MIPKDVPKVHISIVVVANARKPHEAVAKRKAGIMELATSKGKTKTT